MSASIPGYLPVTIVSSILTAVMSVVLIVAGIGLLRMRPWARPACVAYSVYGILSGLASFAYTLAVANPAMVKWQEEEMRRQGIAMPSVLSGFSTFFAVLGLLWTLAYPIALLIVLYRPSVSAAFAEEEIPAALSDKPA